MPIEVRHLRYFLVLADELHFSRAAQRLGIAQPALSRQIRALEAELGVALVKRGPRAVQLTDAGRTFRDEARAAVERFEHATDSARRAGRGEGGRLAVGFSPAADLGLVSRLVSRFVRSHPDVRLEVHTLRIADHAAAIRGGIVQATLLLFPAQAHDDLAVERLVKEPMAVAVSRRSPLARRRSLTIEALSREPLVMLPRRSAPSLYDAVVAAFREARVPLVIAHEADHLHMALALIAAGLGVTLVPNGLVGFCRDDIVYRPLERGPVLELGVMYPRDTRSELLVQFLAVAREMGKRRAARHTDVGRK